MSRSHTDQYTKSAGKLATGEKSKSSCYELLPIPRADALHAASIGHPSKRMGLQAEGYDSVQYNHGGRGGVLIGLHMAKWVRAVVLIVVHAHMICFEILEFVTHLV